VKKLFLSFIAYYSLLVLQCFAQPITWNRIYDGPTHLDDDAYDICESTDGYFYVVGATWMPPSAIYVLKLTPYGDTVWTRIISSPGGEAFAVTSSDDGGCVLTAGGNSSFVIKLSSIGNIVWNNSYGGDYRSCRDIKRTQDGGYVICGGDTEGSYIYGYILKISSIGNLQWQRIYPSGDFKLFVSVEEVLGEGYILVGSVSDYLQDTTKAYILKTNYNGDPIWERRIKINNKTTTGSSINKLIGGFIVGGTSGRYLTTDTACPYFVRTDLNGNITHTEIFQDSISQLLKDLRTLNDNRYVVSIRIDSSTKQVNYAKTRVLITDSLGSTVRRRTFQSDNDLVYWVSYPTNNGDIIFAGEIEFLNTGWTDIIVTRTDSLLNAPPIGIKKLGTEVPADFNLYQNFPNPFNSITMIRFDVSVQNNIKLTIYDLLGRETITLVNQRLSAGSYMVQWNAENFPSGTYVYQLSVPQHQGARKMLLVK